MIGNRFILDREAGSGGMGTVYCAFDRVTGDPVAIKILRGRDAVDIERFAREAAILAELDHPAIVRYVGHGTADSGEHWLALEWLDGEDLAHRLVRGRLSLSETLVLARRVADALGAAHARGMVHRDLKPSNLLLPRGDVAEVKVVDFGIARVAGDPQRLTCTGVLLGTLGYVAPEQIQGTGEADARADVFALGCVLFECLTGQPAFAGAHPMAVLAKILLEGSPLLCGIRPEVPEALDDLVQRMLAKRPSERPRDAAEVAAELAALGEIEDPVETTPAPPRSARRTLPSIPPPSSSLPASLGLSERRLVSVILAGRLDDPGDTLPAQGQAMPAPEIERLVEPFGGRIVLIAGESLVVTIWSNGDATDRAERAAQCALALQARAKTAPVCVVTGRGILASQRVRGDLIDRGVLLLESTRPGVVRLDEPTAAALGRRFDVVETNDGLVLRGLRPDGEGETVLMGRPAPFVGRDREISILESMYAGCVDEPMAGIVLVLGPCGAGKSRLFNELAERAARRAPRPTVLLGRGDSISAGSPFGIVADAIRRAADIRDGEPGEIRRRKLSARVARRVPEPAATRVAAFLGELVSTPFPDDCDEALRAARRDPMLMGDSMRAAWEDFLAAECEHGPVLLVLEDLHWGDAATVRLVDGALRNLHEKPLVVLALARPEVQARFPGLWSERDLQVVRLAPLSRRASEALVREALGASARSEVVAQILERSGGNPFYLQELVRAVAAGRGEALPASVLDAVEARLDAEGSEAKRILRAASIFGRRFSRDGVAALIGADVTQVSAWLTRLEGRELVAPVAAPALPGDADYAFRHALVREAAYATLTDEDRALGHHLAGQWLERTRHTDAMAMATHFRLGRRPRRAVPWYLRAAEQALEASELASAIERATEGLACADGTVEGDDPAPSREQHEVIDPDGERPHVPPWYWAGVLRLIQAEAHVWRGELVLAEERGWEASTLLDPGTEAWFRAATQVILAAGKLGNFERVETWSEPAAATAPHPGAADARLACIGFCASYLIFGGRYEAADRLVEILDEALEGPAPLDARTRATIHQAQSFRASASGDLDGCRVGLEAALAAFEEAGDQRNACATRANLGHIYAELGADDRAEEVLRAAFAAADRMGLCELATFAQSNLGPVLAQRGRLEDARFVEQRAIEAFRAQGDVRLLGVAQTYLARIALVAGDLAAAEREARVATETLAAVQPLRPFAAAVLSRALRLRGKTAEAHAVAAEAYASIDGGAAIEEGEALVRLAHAEALIDSGGDAAEIAQVLSAARARLLERASRIREATWSLCFLTDVPDNARTLELFASWVEADGVA
ncbi:Adenylate cyclase [Minicystis rosea]|nr:Adenylate cyclase [Minicystis rosea]